MKGEENLSVQFLFKAIMLLLGLVLLLSLFMSMKTGRRSVDVSIIKASIDEACERGRYSINISLDNRVPGIVGRIVGVDDHRFIRTYGDPTYLIYYRSMPVLSGYAWDVYDEKRPAPSILDFGTGKYRKGMVIDGLSEKIMAAAEGLGYGERVDINLYRGERGLLVVRNVVANTSILSFSGREIGVNTTNPLSYLWKYFACGPWSLCIKDGGRIYREGIRCKLGAYFYVHGFMGESVMSEFSVSSPCKARMVVERGVCKCKAVDVPIIRYDRESDAGIVESVERTCVPSWLDGGDDEVPCLMIRLEDTEGCVSRMLAGDFVANCGDYVASAGEGYTRYMLARANVYSGYGEEDYAQCLSPDACGCYGGSYDFRWTAKQ